MTQDTPPQAAAAPAARAQHDQAADTPAAGSIAISLNGQPCAAAADCSLAEFLSQHPDTAAMAPAGMASAVNGAFVARARRAEHRLQAGDAVTVFQAIVGG